MTTPVNFPSPLDFGTVSYGSVVVRETSIDKAPAAAKVTATISGGQPFFAIRLTTASGSSDGTTALHVAKGQSLSVSVTLTVPGSGVTPGPSTAVLTVHSAAWGTETVQLTASVLSVDESTPIGGKWLEAGVSAALGAVLANAFAMPDGVGSFQEFANGTIFYCPDYGATLVSSAICDKLNSASVSASQAPGGQIIRDYLGYPTGDSFPTQEQGGQAAYFTQGMVVVRATRQAFVVYGLIYTHYRQLGSIARGDTNPPVVGLPTSDVENAPTYSGSHFDAGDIYQSSAGAFEVHGAIRDRWIATGGPTGPLGVPTSDEMPVMGPAQVVRYNMFAGDGSTTGGARIYWSAATGAWDVSREILTAWLATKDPIGSLGLPTSGPTSTPAGTLFNTFEHGIVVLRAGTSSALPVQGLQLSVFSFRDDAHDKFNVQIRISDSRGQVNDGRMPPSGPFDNGAEPFDPPAVLMSVDPASPVTSDYTLDVWMLCIHENPFGSDDEDGTVTAHFDIDNAWGIGDPSDYSDNSFHVVMQPIPEPQNVSTDPSVFRTTFFWPFTNFDTDPLIWGTYAQTFADVGIGDADFNLGTLAPWNWHLFERAFYQLVYRTLGEHGNCFGMCLEALYARNHLTPFVEPIFDSPDNSYQANHPPVNPSNPADATPPDPGNTGDAAVAQQINIKHGYQLGAGFIAWFLGEKLIGALHNPKGAFQDSHDAFQRGDWPLLTISQDDALSASGHVVVPFNWHDTLDTSYNPPARVIDVANPNAPGTTDGAVGNRIMVHDDNSFLYVHSDGSDWRGTDSSGGRLLSIPFSQLNTQPVTLGDAIFELIAGGVIIIMAGDGQAAQMTDAMGRTLYAVPTQHARDAAVGFELNHPTSLVRTARRLNTDPATRIPNMMVVPLHDVAQSQQSPGVEPGGVQPTRELVTGRLPSVPIAMFGQQAAGTPFDVYYLKRPAPPVQWPRPVRFDDRLVADKTARVSAFALPEAHLASGSAGTAAQRDLHVRQPTAARAPALTVPASAPATTPTTTARLLTSRFLGQSVRRSVLEESAITIQATGSRTGTYQLAVFSPRMSATISSPTAVASTDIVTLDQLGAAAQSMTFTPDKAAAARQFTVAITGWRGDRNPTPRSYVLDNLAVQPGHALVASINDGGKELWLTNPGDAATFDLTVFAGVDASAAISRPNIVLDAKAVTRIRPANWEVTATAAAKISVAVFDTHGVVVREQTI